MVDETPVKAGRRRASKSKYPSEDWVVTTADEDSCGEVDEQSADQNVNDENYEADKECQGTPKGLEKVKYITYQSYRLQRPQFLRRMS